MFGRLIAIAFTLVRIAGALIACWILGGILGDQLRDLRRGRAGDDELWNRTDDALTRAHAIEREAVKYDAKPATN